jgi:hypothetical protein
MATGSRFSFGWRLIFQYRRALHFALGEQFGEDRHLKNAEPEIYNPTPTRNRLRKARRADRLLDGAVLTRARKTADRH